MPSKRNNCRLTHMTEEEREAAAREAAAREAAAREVATHPVSPREEQWAVACELQAKLAAAREARANKRLIEKWRATNPPCFIHPSPGR